jgi:predicted DNA-binding transcriptional regulator AlpA
MYKWEVRHIVEYSGKSDSTIRRYIHDKPSEKGRPKPDYKFPRPHWPREPGRGKMLFDTRAVIAWFEGNVLAQAA